MTILVDLKITSLVENEVGVCKGSNIIAHHQAEVSGEDLNKLCVFLTQNNIFSAETAVKR